MLGSSNFEQLQLKRGSAACSMPDEGLVVARCTFANNTAALTGVCRGGVFPAGSCMVCVG
jgi:hypothetical protein